MFMKLVRDLRGIMAVVVISPTKRWRFNPQEWYGHVRGFLSVFFVAMVFDDFEKKCCGNSTAVFHC